MNKKTLYFNNMIDPEDNIVRKNFGRDGAKNLSNIMKSILSLSSEGGLGLQLFYNFDTKFTGFIRTYGDSNIDWFKLSGLDMFPFNGNKVEIDEKSSKYTYSISLSSANLYYSTTKKVIIPHLNKIENPGDWSFLDELGTILKKYNSKCKITILIKGIENSEIIKKYYTQYSKILTELNKKDKMFYGVEDLESEIFDDLGLENKKIDKVMEYRISDIHRTIQDYSDELNTEPCFQCMIMISSDNKDEALLTMSRIGEELFSAPYYDVKEESIDYFNNSDDFFTDTDINLNYIYKRNIVENWFSLPVVQNDYPKSFTASTEPQSKSIKSSCIKARDNNRNKGIVLDENTLSKHLFITGSTGSGKTKTISNILSQLWRDNRDKGNIPFLLIEPTKKEYRSLKKINNDLGKDLIVLTPGREDLWPLRINPFKPLDLNKPLIEHINLLETAFRAALPMPDILPLILNESLQRVYKDKGWSILRGNPHDPKAPDMNDLVNCMRKVINEKGYDPDVKKQIITMFEVRFGRLQRDIMGQLFYGNDNNPSLDILFENPVVIELDGLHEDNKNLVALFLMIMLREYRRNCGQSKKLKHVLVIDEAHVILGRELNNSDNDYAFNPKEEATNFVENLLAEIRAFGEGIIIGDQSPSVIPQAVLRNTRTKICHQISDPNDKQTMVETMGITEEQIGYLSRLKPGDAFYITEDYYHPVEIHIELSNKLMELNSISDKELMNEILNDTYRDDCIYKTISILEKQSTELFANIINIKNSFESLKDIEQISYYSNYEFKLKENIKQEFESNINKLISLYNTTINENNHYYFNDNLREIFHSLWINDRNRNIFKDNEGNKLDLAFVYTECIISELKKLVEKGGK